MTKIAPEHLARGAYVYVRQSTADQLMHNHESRRRQYGLAERARQLGWQKVVVIDDDLGRSGSGAVCRPGFERLLAAICEGRVGAVLSVEASRLARNGRDWHTLLEFCALVGSLLLDEDGIVIGSRRIRTGECRRRSPWCLPSSLNSRAFARCIFGYARKGSHSRPLFMRPRCAASSGSLCTGPQF